jgi:hypothetical protein
MFFVSLFAVGADAHNTRRPAVHLLAGAMLVTQSVLVFWGDRMARTWDESEVRELLIPLAFVLLLWPGRQAGSAQAQRQLDRAATALG